MRAIGVLLAVGVMLLPLIWFVPLMAEHDPIAVFSQYIGSVSLIAMSVAQLLATRMRWQQVLFGGLDQIYRLHKWLGITAIVTILLHDTIDAEIDALGRQSVLGEIAETLGELSLYGLLILVVITIATYIPYHIWRWTHQFMGAFFAASAFHYFFILKPFINIDPPGLYVGGFCVMGLICYVYTLLPFGAIEGRHRYKVSSVEPTGDAVAVSLEPVKKGLVHRAGQFAFVKFPGKGRDEIHPFTISKGRDSDRNLRFTFKPLGDDTKRLARDLAPGDEARLSPAFGHFSRSGRKPEIWIAGGIGVTPFAAFAQELDETSAPVYFFYCVSEAKQAAHRQDFENLAERLPNFHFHLVETRAEGRLTMDRIEAALNDALSDVTVFYCGPKGLREAMQKAFVDAGLSGRRFKYEEFEIRSGIAITPFLNFVAKLFSGLVGDRLKGSRFDPAKGQ